jgi:NodT family efflux transporter outer membrane factor (OMF) lipoprotein
MAARRRALPLLVAAALALAGCALESPPKPDAIRSQSLANVAIPRAWTAGGGATGAVADDWVAAFDDVELTMLVDEALNYNADLQLAAARVELAAAYAKLAGAAIYPSVNLLAHGGGKMGGDGSGLSGVGLFVSWELDLWGRVRSQAASGSAQYESALADAQFAQASIAAGVAKAWILAIEAKLQRDLAEEIARSAERAAGLARDRLRVGIGDAYDVALADATVETTREAARGLALGQEQARRALETLVGRYPGAAIEVRASLPAMPGPVPVGLPSELLERRPDVIAAERRVAAAFHAVGEAKAARLPKIALTASVSSVSSSLFVLQNHSNPVWSLGANLVAPIFNGYALQAQVDIRTAEQKLAVADYGRIGARAFGEVESALSAGFAADERETILARSVASNARALELAKDRFRVGSGDLRAVLQQGVALGAARASELRMASERRVQRVNVYLALGGSFEATAPRADAADPASVSTAAAPVTAPAR